MVHDHDFTEVTFPQDPRNCTKCHDGANELTPEGDNWKLAPNRLSCGACHTEVDFAAGTNHPGGAQADDSLCAACHPASAIEDYHVTEDSTPHNQMVPDGASVITYELHEARVDAATNVLEVDFTILRDGAALDILDLPTDLTEQGRFPSILRAWALPQGGIQAPADYNNTGNNAGSATSTGINTLLESGDIADAGDGVFTAALADAFPVGSTLRSVALQSYFRQTIPGTDEYWSRHTPSVQIPVTGDEERRHVVDSEKCAGCHDSLQLHGGSRVKNVQVCVMCHVPTKSSGGRGADPANLPEATIAAVGDDPLLFPEDSMHFKNLVHGIHSGEKRELDFEFVRNRAGGIYYNFSEVTFPGILQNCETCHLEGAYLPDLPNGVLPSTVVTTTGLPDETMEEINAVRDTVPNDTDLVSSPVASTCYGCHAATHVEAHIEQMGGVIAEPRAPSGLSD